MTVSMTAFARSEDALEDCLLVWEIRTVNHRYLDINLKLPDEIRQLDTRIRQLISSTLNRGRVDAHLKLEKATRSAESLSIDHALASDVAAILHKIQNDNPGVREASSIDVMRWPGVIQESQTNLDELHDKTLRALQSALKDLVKDRKREGQRLGEIILEKVSQCETIRSEFLISIPEIQEKTRAKWQKRIDEITTNVDPERVAQEIALLLTRSDVIEELDRLETHLAETRKLLSGSKPKGRSLDFLMQELNREANTLGSKSQDSQTTQFAVDLKVLIEQMREQVQNIE